MLKNFPSEIRFNLSWKWVIIRMTIKLSTKSFGITNRWTSSKSHHLTRIQEANGKEFILMKNLVQDMGPVMAMLKMEYVMELYYILVAGGILNTSEPWSTVLNMVTE